VKTIPDVRLKQARLTDPHSDTFLPPESFFLFAPPVEIGPMLEKLDIDVLEATFDP
jgi:hypothetical protein